MAESIPSTRLWSWIQLLTKGNQNSWGNDNSRSEVGNVQDELVRLVIPDWKEMKSYFDILGLCQRSQLGRFTVPKMGNTSVKNENNCNELNLPHMLKSMSSDIEERISHLWRKLGNQFWKNQAYSAFPIWSVPLGNQILRGELSLFRVFHVINDKEMNYSITIL